jgi:hypothetical protein
MSLELFSREFQHERRTKVKIGKAVDEQRIVPIAG